MRPVGSDQSLADQYRDATNLNARIQIYRFSTSSQPWQRWVFEQIVAPPTAGILELGCGPARLWLENAARIPPGWSITLADLSPGMLAEALRNLDTLGQPFQILRADAQSIPFSDAVFDVVIANHMVYHLPDKPSAFAEIRRVLRPGGRFLAATNGAEQWPELSALAGRFDPSLHRALDEQRAAQALLGPASFTLENGGEQLAPWFDDVRLLRSEPATLRVTETRALIDYLLSTTATQALLTGEVLDAFRRFLDAEIASEGAIVLTKDSGMFEARKA